MAKMQRNGYNPRWVRDGTGDVAPRRIGLPTGHLAVRLIGTGVSGIDDTGLVQGFTERLPSWNLA